MIVYDKMFERLKQSGYSKSQLHKAGVISGETLTRMTKGEPINTVTIDRICNLLKCQPGEIMEWKESE